MQTSRAISPQVLLVPTISLWQGCSWIWASRSSALCIGTGWVLLIFITFFHPLLLADKRPARCLKPNRWSSSASATRTQLQLGLKNSLLHAEAAVEEAEGEAIVGGLETSARLGVGCCCFLLVPPKTKFWSTLASFRAFALKASLGFFSFQSHHAITK